MRLGLIMLFVLLPFSLTAMNQADRQAILQRIKPAGEVRVEPLAQASAKTPIVSDASAKDVPGQAVYDKHCSVCHRDGLAGAPKFQNENDWKPRLALKKDLNGLGASAIKGLNAMPARGTCNECTEEDIKNAIDYMLPHRE